MSTLPKKVRKAVIPVAGLGTRFLPASKVVAKELLPIVDRPCIQVVIEELHAAGVREFILVINRGKEVVLEHFRPQKILEAYLKEKNKPELLALVQSLSQFGEVKAVYQDEPKGLGHAVLCTKQAVGDEPFLVALADDLIDAGVPCAQQMVERFEKHGKALVAVQTVPDSEVSKYGIVAPLYAEGDDKRFLDGEKRLLPLKDLVEKPKLSEAPSRFAIVGRYLLTPEIFPLLEKTQKGAIGEIQLTDGLRALNREQAMLAYLFEGKRFDAGDKLGFLQANVHFGRKHPEFGEAFRRFLKEG